MGERWKRHLHRVWVAPSASLQHQTATGQSSGPNGPSRTESLDTPSFRVGSSESFCGEVSLCCRPPAHEYPVGRNTKTKKGRALFSSTDTGGLGKKNIWPLALVLADSMTNCQLAERTTKTKKDRWALSSSHPRIEEGKRLTNRRLHDDGRRSYGGRRQRWVERTIFEVKRRTTSIL